MLKSPLEKLLEVNGEAEIWWDSSPIIYDNWRIKMVNNAADKNRMTAWLNKLFSIDNQPLENVFRGATTNPPLSYKAIIDNPESWIKWVRTLIAKDRYLDSEVIFWETYKEIVRRGAALFFPIFAASDHKYGFISAQVDPRGCHDARRMVTQAMELRSISPNVMIKVPGTAEGYDAIRILTAKGISTNNTLVFVISQYITCMQAVCEGLTEARKNGVDLSGWRSVISQMSGRFGEIGDLVKEASQQNIELSEADIRWAEIAILKKAYTLISKNSEYPGKLLNCAMRISPKIDGVNYSWHIEKMAGANIIYTCPPPYLEGLLTEASHLEFANQIEEPVPQRTLEKLLRISYFAKGYSEDGYTPEQYNSHSALVATVNEFSGFIKSIIDFISQVHVN